MKYYAVKKGKVPGIYTSWSECKAQVEGFSGASYKSFGDKKEANEYLNAGKSIVLNNKTVVYTDGACTGNGTDHAKAGIGVYFGDHRNYSGPFDRPRPSNQRAEVLACIKALDLTTGDVEIITDSMYTINAMTDWIYGWLKNGWKDVKNRDLLEELWTKMQGRNVLYTHVLGHTGVPGNEEADGLAVSGSSQQI